MEQKQENTVYFTQILSVCRKHIWMLIIWSVVLALAGWGISTFVISPKYTSTAQLLVNQKNRNVDPNAAYATQQANMQMVTTYKDIVTSNKILSEASKRLANPTTVVKKAKKAVYRTDENGRKRLIRKAQPAVISRAGKTYVVSVGELAKSISINTQQQSQVFSISAKADTPNKAKAEVNAVAETFSKEIPNIMSVNNVTIVARGTMGVQTSPNVKLFTLAGFVIGLILSFVIVIIREMTDTTVRNDDYLTQEIGLTNLGQISHFHLSSSFSIKNSANMTKRGQTKRRRV